MKRSRFAVASDRRQHPPVLAVSGEIDLANVGEFEKAIVMAGAGAPAVTVDLTGVSYCDSAAVRALFSVAASTELTLIVGEAGHIKTLLSISGLDRVATVVVAD